MTSLEDEGIGGLQATYKVINILAQSQRHSERLLDHLPDIFAVISGNGYVCKGNYALAKFFDLPLENLLGCNLGGLFAESDWEVFLDNISQIGDGVDILEFEMSCQSVAKKSFFMSWKIFPFQSGDDAEIDLYCVIGVNISSLRQREKQLEDLRDHLQDLVYEKTQDIRRLLDSIEAAIFSVDLDLNVYGAQSKFAKILFQVDNFADRSMASLFNLNPEEEKEFLSWANLFKADKRKIKRWTKLIQICPISERELTLGNERVLIKIDIKPIIQHDKMSGFMLFCVDITEKRRVQARLEEAVNNDKMKMERVLGLVNNLQASVAIFLEGTQSYIESFKNVQTPSELLNRVEELFAAVHTIKGNAGTFGFHSLSRLANNAEDVLEEVRKIKNVSRDIMKEWKLRSNLMKEEFEEILLMKDQIFLKSSVSMEIMRDQYYELIDAIESGDMVDPKIILTKIHDLNQLPLQDYCKKYNNIIRMYRVSVGKNINDLKIIDPDFFVHKQTMTIMDTAILHIIRNAIDHGIEADEERQALGKGPGEISLHCYSDGKYEFLEIKDNGRGIDPKKLKEVVINRGLKTKSELETFSEKEILDLIFLSGFSTKEKVSSVSGRGAGLGAARDQLEKHNGFLHFVTKIGVGTKFTLGAPVAHVLGLKADG